MNILKDGLSTAFFKLLQTTVYPLSLKHVVGLSLFSIFINVPPHLVVSPYRSP